MTDDKLQAGDSTGTVSGSLNQILTGTVLLAPVWDVTPIARGPIFPTPADRVAIIGGSESNRRIIGQSYPQALTFEIQSTDTFDTITEKISSLGFINHIVWIAPQDSIQSLASDAFD